MIEEHLAWLCNGAATNDHRIEIAWGSPDTGPCNGRTFTIKEIAAAADQAMGANSQLNNTYVGVTLKHPGTPAHGRTNNDHAALATCMAFDFDSDFATGARLLGGIAQPQLLVVTGTRPAARGQLWVRIEPLSELELWDLFTRDTAKYCAADINAVGVNRLMRLAGTVAYPSSAKRDRGYEIERTQLFQGSQKAYVAMSVWWDLPKHASDAPRHAALNQVGHADQLPLNVTNAAIIQSMLAALPACFADEYQPWRNVGFALHDYDSGPVGLALWKQFSNRCERKAALTNFDVYWSRFGRLNGSSKITLGTLVYHAKQSGWRAPAPWDRVTRIT
jgi:hypothetical protein